MPDHEQAERIAKGWRENLHGVAAEPGSLDAEILAMAELVPRLAAQLAEAWEQAGVELKLHREAKAQLAEARALHRDDAEKMQAQLAEAQAQGDAWHAERDLARAQLAEREREIEAAHVELGRHLCYTGEHEQRRFWQQVQDRAATRSDSEASG